MAARTEVVCTAVYLGGFCSRLLPGSICPRSSTKLMFGMEGTKVVSLGKEPLCTSAQGLPARDSALSCCLLLWLFHVHADSGFCDSFGIILQVLLSAIA